MHHRPNCICQLNKIVQLNLIFEKLGIISSALSLNENSIKFLLIKNTLWGRTIINSIKLCLQDKQEHNKSYKA